MPRDTVRAPQHEQLVNSKIKLISHYNPMLPNINNLIKQCLHILHSDDKMSNTFPRNSNAII